MMIESTEKQRDLIAYAALVLKAADGLIHTAGGTLPPEGEDNPIPDALDTVEALEAVLLHLAEALDGGLLSSPWRHLAEALLGQGTDFLRRMEAVENAAYHASRRNLSTRMRHPGS